MTSQGKFKRAVRRSAQESGKRYTEARSAMEKRKEVFPIFARSVELAPLKVHLEDRYGVRIRSMAPIVASGMTYSGTLRVDHDGGLPWIARVFSSPADTLSRLEGDAEILRFLARCDFPAERLAHEEPVSVMDGSGVIVTEFVEGGRTIDNPANNVPSTWHELASLLGRLHALPPAGGAVARDGGSFTHAGPQHDGVLYDGRPGRCLEAAMSTLVSVEDSVSPDGREKFEWLRDQVENADDAEGLPQALTHGNYNGWVAVGRPGSLVLVGWAGAGHGPRLASLAWLLLTGAHSAEATDFIDAIVGGYSQHIRLTAEELRRLARVIEMVPLSMACLAYRRSVLSGYMPNGGEGWWPNPERAEQLAAKAVAAFRN